MAKKISYLDNLKKELGQFSQAEDKRQRASDKSKYGLMGIIKPEYEAQANAASRKKDKALGQLFGSLLQGRRYDDTTGKQIKAPARIVRKVGPIKQMPKKK